MSFRPDGVTATTLMRTGIGACVRLSFFRRAVADAMVRVVRLGKQAAQQGRSPTNWFGDSAEGQDRETCLAPARTAAFAYRVASTTAATSSSGCTPDASPS